MDKAMRAIYVYRNQLNRLSVEELYLLVQTTRAINSTKQFSLLVIEKYNRRTDNEIIAKQYFGLLYFQASSLWEIVNVLRKDLYSKYLKYLSDELNIEIKKIVDASSNDSDIRLKIIRDIRNKHAYHIASDKDYIYKFIDNEPSRYDLRIGFASSTVEKDIIYTLEDGILISYLMKKYNLDELSMYNKVIDSVMEYTDILLKLFNKILEELMKGKVYTCQWKK